jgi:ABC-type transporter Mla subunit MlaD
MSPKGGNCDVYSVAFYIKPKTIFDLAKLENNDQDTFSMNSLVHPDALDNNSISLSEKVMLNISMISEVYKSLTTLVNWFNQSGLINNKDNTDLSNILNIPKYIDNKNNLYFGGVNNNTSNIEYSNPKIEK